MGLFEKTFYTKPKQDSHVGYGQWLESAQLSEEASMEKPYVLSGGTALIGSLVSAGATALSDENTVVMGKSPYHDSPAKHLTKEDFDSRVMYIRFSDGFLYMERISVQSESLLFTVVQRWTEENKQAIIAHAKDEHLLAIQMQRQGAGKAYGFFEGFAEQRRAAKERYRGRKTSGDKKIEREVPEEKDNPTSQINEGPIIEEKTTSDQDEAVVPKGQDQGHMIIDMLLDEEDLLNRAHLLTEAS